MKTDDPILTTYALGELHDPEAHARVKAAVAADPQLQSVVAEIQSTAAKLNAALADEPAPANPGTLKTPAKRPGEHLSASARAGRIARFEREAPGLRGIGRDRGSRAHYGAYGAALAACLALVGLTVFKNVADRFEEPEIRSDLVEVEPLNPEDLKFRSPAAEALAARIQAEEAEDAAREEAIMSELASLDLAGGPQEASVDPLAALDRLMLAPDPPPIGRDISEGSVAANLPDAGIQYDLPAGIAVARVAPKKPEKPAAEEAMERFTLTPFEVEIAADGSGYVGSSTLAGNRFGADLAQDISAVELGGVIGRYEAPIAERISHESYDRLQERGFVSPRAEPLSTFSIDVDTASYANVRRLLTEGRNPPAGAVRIEELLNYFSYDHAAPETRDPPFSVDLEIAEAPWEPRHRLVRVGLKGYEIAWSERAPSNLVFLIDVSGSMDAPERLPLVQKSLRKLVEKLDGRDHVAIVTYAGAEAVALPSTTANNRETILHTIDRLKAGGSTAGGAGIQRAYELARAHMVPEGNNRVILCTDGDFNVGMTDRAELVEMVASEAASGVFLSVFGFGTDNLNDAMLEAITNRGNGTFAYIDREQEAERAFGSRAAGTLVTIAKDVKVQVEFNPRHVQAYRLIGYENRGLAARDFNDDRKDAGEIGAGHHVTALYEIVPAGIVWNQPDADQLRYQKVTASADEKEPIDRELLTVKLRYKLPDSTASRLVEHRLAAAPTIPSWRQASDDFRWSAAVVGFGMMLRGSEFRGGTDWDLVEGLARSAIGQDPEGARREFLELIALARRQSARGPTTGS